MRKVFWTAMPLSAGDIGDSRIGLLCLAVVVVIVVENERLNGEKWW